jgi:hypothetical protein
VRANSERLSSLLEHSFRSYVGPAIESYPRYSVRIEDLPTDPVRSRPLHTLYEGCTAIVRSRFSREVIGQLRFGLGGAELDATASEHLRVQAQVATRGGAAVLLPPLSAEPRRRLERELLARGIGRLALRTVRIEISSAHLVIPEPFPWDDDAARMTFGPSWLEGSDAYPEAGRYEIRGWILETDRAAPSQAEAMMHILHHRVIRSEVAVRSAMSTLASVLKTTQIGTTRDPGPESVLRLASRMLTGNESAG